MPRGAKVNIGGKLRTMKQRQVGVPELIRRRRDELGWSLREAARNCGIDPGWFHRIENGRTMEPATLGKVAQGLGISDETLALASYGLYYEPADGDEDDDAPAPDPTDAHAVPV